MQGFSLVELMIVTSITLTVAGMAVPKIVSTVANVRMMDAVHSASGIVQATRMQAIKDNAFRKAKYLNGTGGAFVYTDVNDNNTNDSTEQQAQLGNTVLAYSAPSGIPALSSTDLGYSTVTTTAVGFSSTGQTCSALNNCAVGMVMYFTDTRSFGTPGWAAVTVSPAGRVQCWMWSGTAWQQS